MDYLRTDKTEQSLVLTVDFTLGEAGKRDSFELGGSIKKEKAEEVISTWLRGQVGEGSDTREPNKRTTYRIAIEWFPSNDRFVCRSNCGNDSLRDGILLYVLNRILEE